MTGVDGRTLVILTEGGRERGLGHIMRCSAYAEAWADAGGSVRWIVDGDDAVISALPHDADLALTGWQAQPPTVSGDAVLVDSYALTEGGMVRVAEGTWLPVFLDDLGRDAPRGLVVNASLSARAPAAARAEWLCGPGWQPLRAAFRDVAPRPVRSEVRQVLVMMGGSDPRRLTGRMAAAARTAFPDAVVQIIGGEDPAIGAPRAPLDAAAVAALMLRSDVAVSAAGQSIYELARCGVPTVMVQAADNQRPNLETWPGAAGFIAAGAWDMPDIDQRVVEGLRAFASQPSREAVSRRGAALVDGRGASRLISLIAERLGAP